MKKRRLDPTLLLLAPALLFVLALFVYPFIYGFILSFEPYGENEANGILGSYMAFFGDPRERLSIWNTLRLAVPATFIDVALAVPLAYRLRRPVPGQRAITAKSIPGIRESIPYFAAPLTLSRTSTRCVSCPTSVKSSEFFSGTVLKSGMGSFAAASTSSP